MTIVVAPNTFKGSLGASAVARHIADGLRTTLPGAAIVEHPLADGGEGTSSLLTVHLGGEWTTVDVMGPVVDMQVRAGFGYVTSEGTAIVEAASASGLRHLGERTLRPLEASTFGTGQVIRAALSRSPSRLLLTVGDSASTDGGVGAAMALGWQFLNRAGRPIALGGAALQDIRHIVPPKSGSLPEVSVLCDVTDPILGERGAARRYAPQKGASSVQVEVLAQGLETLCNCVESELGLNIRDIPGGAGAGGLAAGATAFLDAKLSPAVPYVFTVTKFADHLAQATWLVTGEGRFDSTSLAGKATGAAIDLGRSLGLRCAVIAGSVAFTEYELRTAGVDAALSLVTPGVSVARVMRNAASRLSDAGAALGRLIQ